MRLSYKPINNYTIMARGDFFAHWLLGSYDTGPDILELQDQKQATPATNGILVVWFWNTFPRISA